MKLMPPLKRLRIKKILLIWLGICLSSCAETKTASTRVPRNPVTVCISAPPLIGMMCSAGGLPPVLVPYDQTDNFLAFPPDSAKDIFDRLRVCEALQ